METRIRVEDAVHGLMRITARTFVLQTWSWVIQAHLLVSVLALGCAWYWQIPPQAVRAWASSFVPKPFAATADGILGFLGASGLTIALAYAKAWQFAVRRLANRYVLDFD